MSLRIITYDFEVVKYDWMVVFQEDTDQFQHFVNDPDGLKAYMDLNKADVFAGFNSKHYDQFIMKGIMGGCTQEQIKSINDRIINGEQGWEIMKSMDIKPFWFNNMDIMDDMQKGQSLKSLEGQMGLPIVESSIPFDIDRPLTAKEIDEMLYYCQHDVASTTKIIEMRSDYLMNKIAVGELAGIEPEKALAMTNAKLTAALLQAVPPETPWADEREYVYPDKVNFDLIPSEVKTFFDTIKKQDMDPNEIQDDDEFWKTKLETEIGGMPVKYGWGGIHGALKGVDISADDETVIINADVASLYPNTMLLFGYMSRNIPDPSIYKQVLSDRLAAKKAGDKTKANALKLVLNTTYGAMLNQYNALYDPLMGRSVCITGQLMLTQLSTALTQIEGLELIQLNTDGVMFKCPKSEQATAMQICEQWCKDTGYELEYDSISRVVQKDVNNYIEIKDDGSYKLKGGYLVKGVAPAGAFKINNDARILSTAIINYFTKGIKPETTINKCRDMEQFYQIAKAGSLYSRAYQKIDDLEIDTQKVNRVFACKDQHRGTLYKVHRDTGQINKIEGLPDHCEIVNADHDDPLGKELYRENDLDEQWYIDKAWNMIHDFQGIKREKTVKKERKTKKVAEKKVVKNIYQRLMDARIDFLNRNVQKSGKNMVLKFTYFELGDIVPTALQVFAEHGLYTQYEFYDENAVMEIYNVDNPEEMVTVCAPFHPVEPNKGTNPCMAIGSSITYMRRYLWMLALDLVEQDSIDSEAPAKTTIKPAAKPVSLAERTTATKQMTTTGDADQAEIDGLKRAVTKLVELNPEQSEFADMVKEATKDYTSIPKDKLSALLTKVKQMIEEAKKNVVEG